MASIQSSVAKQISDIKKNEIAYRTMMQQAILKNETTGEIINIPFSSYTKMYRDLLSQIIVEKELDDKAIAEVRYKPKTLSYVLYGTTEFWNDILILNECKSIIDFTPKKIRYYDPNRLKTYLNQILILEGILS